MHSGQVEFWKRPFKLGVRAVEYDLIPLVGQLELPNVPVVRWIIVPDIHGFFDGSCKVVYIPIHNGQVVHPGVMTCNVDMVIDGGSNPKMFLEPFPKDPCKFPNVHLITL